MGSRWNYAPECESGKRRGVSKTEVERGSEERAQERAPGEPKRDLGLIKTQKARVGAE